MQGDEAGEAILGLWRRSNIRLGRIKWTGRLRELWRSAGPRRLLHELSCMEQQINPEEDALRRAIQTISQSDPLLKLLEQVKFRRMKATDAGLRAVTESWLLTYRQVLSTEQLNGAALRRLDPSPRLAVLVDAGVLRPDHGVLVDLKTLYESRLASAAR